MGVTPLWGLHWLLLLAIGLPLRLDVGVAWLASQVSLPFLAPFLTFAEIQVGARVLRGAWPSVTAADVKLLLASPRGLATLARELVVGTLVVSPASAVLGGVITWAAARLVRARRSRAPEEEPKTGA